MSVRQPLANLIMSGRMLRTGSGVDSRTTSTAYRGTLVLHASARWDPSAAVLADELDLHDEAGSAGYGRGFLGTVQLVDVHPAAGCCAPWGSREKGKFHWLLREPLRFSAPIAGIGNRGLFWTPPLPLAVGDHTHDE
ncbi:hypothetical protein [Amycolatopsis sp. cmx-4-68]|uniref:hypothetical protein n=1 Tax=Amycolatopsis sp. cmx-4-68 TaxID=2790938 RepID=UPI003978FB48